MAIDFSRFGIKVNKPNPDDVVSVEAASIELDENGRVMGNVPDIISRLVSDIQRKTMERRYMRDKSGLIAAPWWCIVELMSRPSLDVIKYIVGCDEPKRVEVLWPILSNGDYADPGDVIKDPNAVEIAEVYFNPNAAQDAGSVNELVSGLRLNQYIFEQSNNDMETFEKLRSAKMDKATVAQFKVFGPAVVLRKNWRQSVVAG